MDWTVDLNSRDFRWYDEEKITRLYDMQSEWHQIFDELKSAPVSHWLVPISIYYSTF